MTRLFGGSVNTALTHALTQYDIRQSRGKRYNVYALAQYLRRIDDITADIANGAAPRAAIIAGFTPGPLRTAALKAIGETPDDTESGSWTYQPAAPRQTELPDTAPDLAGHLRQKAAAPILARKPQAACDLGLFSDDSNQLDLLNPPKETR